MEVTSEGVANDPTTTSSTIIRQTRTSPTICKVCGASAHYSYFGAIVCQSCKVFFRRNAKKRSTLPKCNLVNYCEINLNNRRNCTSCRFAKCIASGMNIEMIRSSWTKQKKLNEKKTKITTYLTSTALIPTLNLLRSDRSTLSVSDWSHLSNLIHCFDQYSGFSFIQNFINEQNALLPKFRFKYAPVNDFFLAMMTNVQLVSEKNRQVFPICLHDRTKLLCTTVEYTTFIGAAFILSQTELFNHPAFLNLAELVFRPTAIALIKRLIDRLDPDVTFIKIMITIIVFLASNYTAYMNTPSTNLMEAKAILRIQDTYTELVWRYLLYKYNFKEAVLCFSNFLRCILLLNDSIVEAHDTQSFSDIIDSVIESTKSKLTINR